jgi:hypothetical protein
VRSAAIKSVGEDAIDLGDWGCGCSPKTLVTSSTLERNRRRAACSRGQGLSMIDSPVIHTIPLVFMSSTCGLEGRCSGEGGIPHRTSRHRREMRESMDTVFTTIESSS